MKAYKSVISFCLLLIAIRHGSSEYKPLDEKTACAKSSLIQYNNYFECVCEEETVHSDDKTCVEPVETCTKADEICGEYAKCVSDNQQPPKFECKCKSGYELDASTPPVCVPVGCKNIGDSCTNGLCVKKNETTAECACHLGFKTDSSGKCTVKNDQEEKCKLTCTGENVECIIKDEKHYDCGCKEGFELKEGKCVKIEYKEEYEPLHEKSVCINSTLIQYNDYFVCACNEGMVHEALDKCEKSTNGKCTKAGDVCGDFAKCIAEGKDKDVKLECKCDNGYKLNNDKKPVCVPIGCESAAPQACGKGICGKESDKIPRCVCYIGNEFNEEQGKCIASKTATTCKLTCTGENVDCVEIDNKYFECGCKKGYALKEGKCQLVPVGSAYPASGILNVGLLFLVSSIIYILV